MLSFKTKSYIEGIWNALCGVDYKVREWDCFDLEDFITRTVRDGVPIILSHYCEKDKNYKAISDLGELAKKATAFEPDYPYINDKAIASFPVALSNIFHHLWF